MQRGSPYGASLDGEDTRTYWNRVDLAEHQGKYMAALVKKLSQIWQVIADLASA